MKLKDACSWKKNYDQSRQPVKKQRHYFANKGLPSQSCDFSRSHFECESWTIKKAKCWRTDAFELWCWRWLLRVPWMARRSNQSILNKISPECSLEGLMLKLKFQYFGHLMWRTDSFEKTLMLGNWGLEEKATPDVEMVGWHHCLDGLWVWVGSGHWWWTRKPGVL